MMNGWYGMGTGAWIFMALFWIALVALVVWVVASLTTRTRDDADRSRLAAGEPPERILARRLAAGEIDPETYDTLRARLASGAERG